MEQQTKIPKRISATLLHALTAGVVPRVGLEYVNAGRKQEISAFLQDLETVGEGGAACRFVVGKYGAGKSFLLQMVRNVAMEKDFCVCDCDLSPERRFTGSRGQGLATYRELIAHLATKTRPEGGALSLLLERWLSGIWMDLEGGSSARDEGEIRQNMRKAVCDKIATTKEMVCGFEFSRVILTYLDGYLDGDDVKKNAALRWLRGEYETKTEAKAAIGAGSIITDDNWYEMLKVLAVFVTMAGYAGLIVLLDELVNLYKIPQSVTRQANYEKILTLFNDTMQGRAHHIAFFLGGTPGFVDDTRKGLFSYEALRSRLEQSRYTKGSYHDLMGPVIRLEPLNNEELYLLCENIVHIHESQYGYTARLTHADYLLFLNTQLGRIGADTLLTPREITRDLIEILNLMYQNQGLTMESILGADFSFSKPQDVGDAQGESDPAFADFTL